MKVKDERIMERSGSRIDMKTFEDGTREEIHLDTPEYVKTGLESNAVETDEKTDEERWNNKTWFAPGFHDDGTEITEEEMEMVEKILYGE